MKAVGRDVFVKSILPGDVGILRASNFFGKLQALYAHRFNEGPMLATHGFLVKAPPIISEANGLTISGHGTFLKSLGDKTEVWFFRYGKLTPEQLDDVMAFVKGSEQTGGHYSILGIWEFAKAFLTGKQREKDRGGVFCTEYTSDAILAGGLPYMSVPSWQIDPTVQLNWMAGKMAAAYGWTLAAHYDAAGNYSLNEALGASAA